MRLVAPAVACIGNGHPVVREAIKEKSISSLVSGCLISGDRTQVYGWHGPRRTQYIVVE